MAVGATESTMMRQRKTGNTSGGDPVALGPTVYTGERYGSMSSRRERMQNQRTFKNLSEVEEVGSHLPALFVWKSMVVSCFPTVCCIAIVM